MLEVYCINYADIAEEWVFDDIDRGDIGEQFETYCVYDTEKKEITHSLLAMPENRGWVMGYVHAHQLLYKTNFYQITFNLENKSQARLLPYIVQAIEEAREMMETIEQEKAVEFESQEETMVEDEAVEDCEVTGTSSTEPEFCRICQKRGLVKVCGDYENCPHYKPYDDGMGDCDEAAQSNTEKDAGVSEFVNDKDSFKKLKEYVQDAFKDMFSNVKAIDEAITACKGVDYHNPDLKQQERHFCDVLKELQKKTKSTPEFNAREYFENILYPRCEQAANEGLNEIFVRFTTLSNKEKEELLKYLKSCGFRIRYVDFVATTYIGISW